MYKRKEHIYISFSKETVTIFIHNYLVKQGMFLIFLALPLILFFYKYMVENFGFFFVIFLFSFLLLLFLIGIINLRNDTPLMIMDNRHLSFPRVHPDLISWHDLDRIVFRRDHMILFLKKSKSITIWVDHRWPFPCLIIRNIMIKKRKEANIHTPPASNFFISN